MSVFTITGWALIILAMPIPLVAYLGYDKKDSECLPRLSLYLVFFFVFSLAGYFMKEVPIRERKLDAFLKRNHTCIKRLVSGGAREGDAREVCRREEEYRGGAR